jgi:hypothetical protein
MRFAKDSHGRIALPSCFASSCCYPVACFLYQKVSCSFWGVCLSYVKVNVWCGDPLSRNARAIFVDFQFLQGHLSILIAIFS